MKLLRLLFMVPMLISAAEQVPLRTDYEAVDYSHLLGMPGFSRDALQIHLTLYQGYVKNTNLMLKLMDELPHGSPQWAGLKRRFGWEWDGMRLHEFYFGSLGGDGKPDENSPLYRAIEAQWGSFDTWRKDYEEVGLMRGIGWAIFYQDPASGQLINTWINEHDLGHLAGAVPILNMDVFEHAYMLDYGLDRKGYINAFFNNLDWSVVEQRYQPPLRNPTRDRSGSNRTIRSGDGRWTSPRSR